MTDFLLGLWVARWLLYRSLCSIVFGYLVFKIYRLFKYGPNKRGAAPVASTGCRRSSASP